MVREIRHLADVNEIQAIELRCPKPKCVGMLRIDPTDPGALSEEQDCPRCGAAWWSGISPSPVYRALAALLDLRCGTLKGATPSPTTQDVQARFYTPSIVLVLPAETTNP